MIAALAAIAAQSAPVQAPAIAHTYGPELFPQPAFAGTTGLNLSFCSVSGGELIFDDSGNLTCLCDGTTTAAYLATDTLVLSITILDTLDRDVSIKTATSFGAILWTIPAGTVAGTYATTVTGHAASHLVISSAGQGNDVVNHFGAFSAKVQLT